MERRHFAELENAFAAVRPLAILRPYCGADCWQRRLVPAAQRLPEAPAVICDKHGILLIDEVIIAFGRLAATWRRLLRRGAGHAQLRCWRDQHYLLGGVICS
jgi:hypothetical protein